MTGNATRFAAIFGGATILAHVGQLAWLGAGSRAMDLSTFGVVLAAQALYGIVQYGVDYGTGLHGARLSAQGELAPTRRHAIVRARVQLSLIGAAVMVGVGLVGGRELLLAVSPFVLALPLFALLRHWEHFGRSDARAWSLYLVLRGWGPAAAAGVALTLDRPLAAVVPGIVECAAVLTVAASFRFRPASELIAALGAHGRELAVSVRVGAPSFAWQAGLLSAPVVLAAGRNPLAAATLGAALRLLTGVNQLAGVLATTLFPALAQGRGMGLRTPGMLATLLPLTATAIVLVATSPLTAALLGTSDHTAAATVIIVIGMGPATAVTLLAATASVARGDERRLLRPFLAGTGLSGAALAVVATSSGDAASAAAAVALGQVVALLLVTRVSPALGLGTIARFAALSSLAAVAAAALPELRTPLAILLGGAVLAALLPRVSRRRQLGRPDAVSEPAAY